MSYFLWVVAGVLLAGVAVRWQGEQVLLDERQRRGVVLAALGGAIAGAYGLELPADLLGWNGPPPPGVRGGDALPLGGRTVLGGLLGGWLAVEVAKRMLRVRVPTGDGFALPLALALGCGRLGCVASGCCAGVPCAPAWWAFVDASGTARVPVQALEALFHFGAAAGLAFATRRGWQRGRRLALYLAGYAVLRIVLEQWRMHPPVALGLTWFQALALALQVLAGGTWWRRSFGRPVRVHMSA